MTAPDITSENVARVAAVLAAHGMRDRLRKLDETGRTAAEAAAALGCDVAQIAKSIVFRHPSGAPALVIASGVNRVDEKRVAALLPEPPGKADAAFVRATSGFAIGGVSPIGWLTPVVPLIDRDLLAYDVIWAAAGGTHDVFHLTPDELVTLTGGTIADVKRAAT